MLINIILWIVLGALAGWIASMIMGRDAQMGPLANIIVGIVGALIGGFIMNFFGQSGATGFNLWSLIVATLGAIVLLFLLGLVRRASFQSSSLPIKRAPVVAGLFFHALLLESLLLFNLFS